MQLPQLLFVLLATWYLTQAVTLTKGPFGIFSWARAKERWHGGLLECHVCFSLWAALFFVWLSTLLTPASQIILEGVAIAGLFVILWDATVFFKTVIEAWLYAIQLAAQQPTEAIVDIRNELDKANKQIAAQKEQLEALNHAQQDIAPLITILRASGCESLAGGTDQPGQQQQSP